MSSPDSLPSFINYNVGDIFAEADLSGESLIRNRSAKALGELAEMAFSYKAASLGFGIAKPLGDNEAFDFILNAGHRLWKVQVKSTYHRSRGGYYGFHTIRAAVGGKTRTYTAEAIDVLAAWVMPLDMWYIIPVQAFVPRRSLRVYPDREASAGAAPFEPFREAWCLLACSGEDASDNRILLDRCSASESILAASSGQSPCPLKGVLERLQSQAPSSRPRR